MCCTSGEPLKMLTLNSDVLNLRSTINLLNLCTVMCLPGQILKSFVLQKSDVLNFRLTFVKC